MLRATWRGLETWHGRDTSANWRASPRPYREGRSSFFNRAAGGKTIFSTWGGLFSWPVDRRAKDPSLALGQACPGSEQEGPARGRAVPSQATERRAREVACLPTGASLGGTQPRFLNKLRPAGVMVLSAVCPMRASRNLASGRRAPLCPVRDQRGERVATKNAGLPCLVPAGRATASRSADFGKLLPSDGSHAVICVAVQRYSL